MLDRFAPGSTAHFGERMERRMSKGQEYRGGLGTTLIGHRQSAERSVFLSFRIIFGCLSCGRPRGVLR